MSVIPDGGASEPDLFVSYSRADEAFVRRLDAALRARGKDVWVDWDDIPPTADWRARIYAGIESSRSFVAVLSPDLVASAICAEELAYATRSNKRVVAVLRREIDRDAAPQELVAPNWIFFRESDDFDGAVETLVDALETDLEWLDAHARLLVRATEWEREQREGSFLLRGRDLADAEAWLGDQGSHREAATSLQTEFVLASRKAAARRQRALFAGVTVALAVAVVLGVVALIQRNNAIDQSQVSRSRELAASAISQLASDPELSVLLAREALDERETPQAEEALVRSLRQSHLRLVVGDGSGPATNARFSPDGTRIAAATGKLGRVWDARTGRLVARLRGHRRPITSLRFSPDGRRVVTASEDGTARLWVARTGKPVAVLGDGKRPVTIARFSPDGTLVLTGGDDGRAVLWSARTGKARAVLPPESGIDGAEFSADGRRLVTSSHAGFLRVWDVRSGTTVFRIPASQFSNPVYSPSFSPDGKRLITADPDVARVWSARTGQPLHVIHAHAYSVLEIYVRAARFSPTGLYALTAGADGTARVWGVPGWQQVAVLSGHAGEVLGAEYSPDGTRIVTVGEDGTARVWDSLTGEAVALLRVPGGRIADAEFASDSNRVVTATDDGVRVWETSGIAPTRRIAPPRDAPPHQDVYLKDAVFSPDGQVVASVSSRPSIRLWSVAGGKPVARLRGDGLVAFSPDGRRAVTGLGKVAIVWNAATGKEIRRLRGHRGPLRSVAFDRDGSRVLTTAHDGTARVWSAATGRVERIVWMTPRFESGQEFVFSPDGSAVAGSGPHGAVVREVATRTLTPLAGSYSGIYGEPAFSPDGSRVYVSTGNGDPTFEPGAKSRTGVWDAATGAPVATFGGGTQSVGGVFSDDARLVLTRDRETARVWDAATGRALAAIRGHGSSNTFSLEHAELSPDGRLVLTAGAGGTAKVWDARTGELVAVLRAVVDASASHAASARFSPDGRNVAVVGVDSLRLYSCEECGDLAALRALADLRVRRTLTAAERARLAAATG